MNGTIAFLGDGTHVESDAAVHDRGEGIQHCFAFISALWASQSSISTSSSHSAVVSRRCNGQEEARRASTQWC